MALDYFYEAIVRGVSLQRHCSYWMDQWFSTFFIQRPILPPNL